MCNSTLQTFANKRLHTVDFLHVHVRCIVSVVYLDIVGTICNILIFCMTLYNVVSSNAVLAAINLLEVPEAVVAAHV